MLPYHGRERKTKTERGSTEAVKLEYAESADRKGFASRSWSIFRRRNSVCLVGREMFRCLVIGRLLLMMMMMLMVEGGIG